jgi:hypothetical protein
MYTAKMVAAPAEDQPTHLIKVRRVRKGAAPGGETIGAAGNVASGWDEACAIVSTYPASGKMYTFYSF